MAAPRVKVVTNRDALRQLRSEPTVAALVRSRAERVRDEARSTAPVLTGAYRDSIVVLDRSNKKSGGRFSIGSDVPYAMVLEARTGNLARAIDAARGS